MHTGIKLSLLVFTIMLTGSLQSRNFISSVENTIKCNVKGEVIDRPESKILYLYKKGGDFRIEKEKIEITDGKFSFSLEGKYEEAYQLSFEDEIMNGAWRPVNFFLENGEIRMTLYPMERSEENILEGGPLTKEYYSYQKLLSEIYSKCYEVHQSHILKNFSHPGLTEYRPETDFILSKETPDPNLLDLSAMSNKLRQEDGYDSDKMKELNKKMQEANENGEREEDYWEEMYVLQKTGEHLSEKAKEVEKLYEIISSYVGDWEITYIEENPSLVNLEQLLYAFKLSLSQYPAYYTYRGKAPRYIEVFRNIYEKKYPDHPLTEKMRTQINSYTAIKPGGRFIDFTAPDFKDKEITLSSQIEGKIALIDLWASWCGPCRRKAISMIPVYEEFKDKGFTVVGVAREQQKQDAIRAAEQDQYPWLNLVEIKDRDSIWQKYGIGNAGGSTFLVDKDGTILAVAPTAEEVKKILSNKLN